ncbi:hypothetical protein B1F85_26420 [Pseudomonas syringae pv. actinidiae]|nr:hypothetical protein B1F85_26420 [Pseudomonas syringae pv. actinidiae]
MTGCSAIQRRHIIELAYKPIQFCQVTFDNSPLIGRQGRSPPYIFPAMHRPPCFHEFARQTMSNVCGIGVPLP